MHLSLIFVSAVSAATALCNNSKSQCTAFDFSKFQGKWFEIGATGWNRDEFGYDCTCTAFVFQSGEKGAHKMTKSCLKGMFKNDIEVQNAELKAKAGSTSQFRITYPKKHLKNMLHFFSFRANYEIKNVWTDAQGNYQHALVVSPKKWTNPDFIEKRFESYWILSRSNTIPDEELNAIQAYALGAGFHPDHSDFEKTEQTKCANKQPLFA